MFQKLNVQFNLLAVCTIILIAAITTACAPAASTPTSVPPTQVPAPTVAAAPSPVAAIDPITIAKAYVETANTGDFDKTLAFYADDAVSRNGAGLFIGKAQVAKWLEVDVKTTRATPREWKMQGALVVNTGTVSLDRFVKAGVGAVEYRNEYLIDKNGKIRFLGPVVMLTPEQQDKMRASSPPPPAPAINPTDVVKAYVDAANTGDFDKAIAFYADDSSAFVVNGTLLLTNKSQIAEWLKGDVKTTRATPKEWQVTGNTVVNIGMVSLDRFVKLGIDSVQYRSEYIVENGKIRFFYPTVILTPEQQAKIAAASATPTPAK